MSPLKNEAILIAFPLLPTQISAQISLKMFRFLVSLNHIVLINVPEGKQSPKAVFSHETLVHTTELVLLVALYPILHFQDFNS